ncbi:MAG: hypothetical protein WCS53_02690 [Bacilli bacterium]
MLIQIRYPNIQKGQIITIRTGFVKPVRRITIDGEPMTRVDDHHYRFFSTIANKEKVIEITPTTLDFPKVAIDQRELYYFEPLTLYEKLIMLSPVLVGFFFGGIVGILLGFLSLLLTRRIMLQSASKWYRYGLVLLITAGFGFLSFQASAMVTDLINAWFS